MDLLSRLDAISPGSYFFDEMQGLADAANLSVSAVWGFNVGLISRTAYVSSGVLLGISRTEGLGPVKVVIPSVGCCEIFASLVRLDDPGVQRSAIWIF